MSKNIKRAGVIFALLFALVSAIVLIKTQYDAYLNSQETKARAESIRLINAMKQQAIFSQKAWVEQGKPSIEEDGVTSQEINDTQELAQAKLWQKLSPEKRVMINRNR